MRRKISWSDLVGARVGVWGTGVEGRAGLRKLRSLGVVPHVVVDDRPIGSVDGLAVVGTSEGGLDALAGCEVVVKTPGLSPYRPEVVRLVESGVALVGGLGLWLEEADRDRVICVTGTKGKSTTVSVAGHLLRRLGHRCFVGGNLGQPPFDPDAPDDVDFWVIEVSSYQATDVASSPPVVAVTSLNPDHLDWHGPPGSPREARVDHYYGDKLSLCSQPGAELTVANGEDARIRARRSLLGPRVEWVTATGPVPTWTDGLGLLGRHNQVNVLIARAAIAALGVDADDETLVGTSAGFDALPSRLRPIGTVDGVTFVDDSLSTNVLPTLAALSVFEGRRVALLVGGHDRHIDYTELAERLAARPDPTLVLALPQTGPEILRALAAAGPPAGSLEGRSCAELGPAVEAGFDWARPGGVVLLSPAAASFGQFRDYQERAAAFLAAAERCGAVHRSEDR